MLKKKALNRIFIVTISIAIVFAIYTLSKIDNMNSYGDDYTYISEENMGTIYLPSSSAYLVSCSIYVDRTQSLEEQVKSVLSAMIEENNKNSLLPTDIKPILPRNTRILSVVLDDDILKVDFSREILSITLEQAENMISAIVYTLTSFKDVLGVQISANSNIIKYVPNTTKELPTILTRDIGINKVYDLKSNLDIEKVFLYYYQDNNYEVPVTKYLNSDREKLEIIVESLSNTIKNDNLISYLDYNIKLVSYEIASNVITLNFDQEIVDAMAINSLTSSIFANYDIENIRFLANNHKFLEKNIEN